MAKTIAVDSSSTNVPAAYSTASGSKVVNQNAPTSGFIGVINKSSTDIQVATGSYADTSVPATSQGFPVLATNGATTLDWYKVTQNDSVFIKSLGSTISSGVIYIIFK